MAYAYIILSGTGAIGGGKRVRVFQQSYRQTSGTQIATEITLNAKRYGALDIDLPAYTMDCYVREAESDTNYFSLSALRAIRFASTVAARKLKYQDPYGTTRDVLWTSTWDPAPALPALMDGAEGWYLASITLETYA